PAHPTLIRPTEVWFDDGTVVLQAEGTLFWCTVASWQSPIFRDMVTIPQPSAGDTYEGCPLIILQDSPKDLALFL
ncbi:hypothetical protein FB451DRAFT_971995, partial [Mycena latifolia]